MYWKNPSQIYKLPVMGNNIPIVVVCHGKIKNDEKKLNK